MNLDARLRLGYLTPLAQWKAYPPITTLPRAALTELAALRQLTAVELDLELCPALGDAGVRAVLACPLGALLLWNVRAGDLPTMTPA